MHVETFGRANLARALFPSHHRVLFNLVDYLLPHEFNSRRIYRYFSTLLSILFQGDDNLPAPSVDFIKFDWILLLLLLLSSAFSLESSERGERILKKKVLPVLSLGDS